MTRQCLIKFRVEIRVEILLHMLTLHVDLHKEDRARFELSEDYEEI